VQALSVQALVASGEREDVNFLQDHQKTVPALAQQQTVLPLVLKDLVLLQEHKQPSHIAFVVQQEIQLLYQKTFCRDLTTKFD
tara:strand:- start:413 stop:661 length:249 start_codon:yes stop_codon:yes gene_type:complete